MTHVVHPYSHRLIILKDWKSRWFAGRPKYKDLLKSDILIRHFIEKELKSSFVSSVEIERSEKASKIIIRTSRPGMVIGRSGEGLNKLKDSLTKFVKKNKLSVPDELKIDVVEVSSPDSDAMVIAKSVAEGLEKRMPFRRVVKQTMERIMRSKDVKGARIVLAGRLGGADMARKEEIKRGAIPLQTLRTDIDFARVRAKLPYGDLGIKVWINKGEVFEEDKK